MSEPADSTRAAAAGEAEAPEALRRSEALFREAFVSSPALYSITDLPGGRYVDANAAWLAAFGFSRDEVIGRDSVELGIWAVPADRERYMALARGDDGHLHFEAEFRTRAGQPLHLAVYTSRIEIEGVERMLVMSLDRSAERRAERDARRAQRRLVDAIESLTEGFVLYDADDRIVLCNARYREMYDVPDDADIVDPGRRFEEFIRYNVDRGLFPQARGREAAFVGERIDARRHPDAPPLERQMADGRWLLLSDRRTARGELVGIRTDITRLKQVEQELIRLNEQLERRVQERTEELRRAERLATLGKLTGTVAHEIRNPLGTIRVCTHIISERLRDRGIDLDAVIGRLNRSVRRCDNIINELLDFARAPALNLRRVAFDRWLERQLGELTLPDGVELRTEFALDGVDVMLDTSRMRRVLVNVVDNAIQAIEGEIGPDRPAGRGVVTVATALDVEQIVLEVRDTGPGIEPDLLPRLFEPLFSTKSFGVGLGLPTVRQIMDQHGGTVQISNGSAGGARVRLMLPNRKDAPPDVVSVERRR